MYNHIYARVHIYNISFPSCITIKLLCIPIGITFLDTVGYIAKVEGVSMQPTLNPDERNPDYVFLNRRAIRTQDIQRGEIVTVKSPKTPEQILIKRVVGLSGDIVRTHGYQKVIVG
ncbi:mitochondrial inner membrane protease subunit 2 isoform X1 [Apis mellifera caucasica]|uniref:Mitochondrial inner membrane protease subunit n=1 Tax=Apis mellifera TaxID=7460 RepID=A0A7M7MW75_APIME|nr:mitochondrial inner membrane protease subunit 2 isoform X1 [Apis mellifera]KAG6802501.1 mitochondrial inner membrane protease subunit 2 isoform X1 [Apis mellifera caucasica]KAG9437924.1 mitochondrial inner membrane protease subunit 2 isoform X1 [Apis mellifera carnica]|eukprot:XP_026301949.1 mitochondrial inner membrane protease subunit 2 isoform X1 [Apis mellifera]